MTPSDKAQFWQQHITAWKTSGLSQAEYCLQQEINFHTFAYWRTRLNRAAAPTSRLLRLGGVTTSSQMTRRLPLGIRLELAAQDLPTVLPLVLHTVRDTL